MIEILNTCWFCCPFTWYSCYLFYVILVVFIFYIIISKGYYIILQKILIYDIVILTHHSYHYASLCFICSTCFLALSHLTQFLTLPIGIQTCAGTTLMLTKPCSWNPLEGSTIRVCLRSNHGAGLPRHAKSGS